MIYINLYYGLQYSSLYNRVILCKHHKGQEGHKERRMEKHYESGVVASILAVVIFAFRSKFSLVQTF